MQDSRVSSETSNFSFWRPQSFIKDPKLSSRRIDFQRRIQLFIGDRKHSQITASSHQNPKHFRGDTRFLNLGLKLFIGDPKLFIGAPKFSLKTPTQAFHRRPPICSTKTDWSILIFFGCLLQLRDLEKKPVLKISYLNSIIKHSNSMCVRKKVCYNHKQQFFW